MDSVKVARSIVTNRLNSKTEEAKVSSCHTYRGNIEIQAELWMHNNGSWPVGNLADIKTEIEYFPEGLPVSLLMAQPIQLTLYRTGNRAHPLNWQLEHPLF